MVSLDQAAHSRRPDRATLLLMNEGLPRQGILRSSVIHFHCKCFPARTPAPKCFLNFEFNGVDGLRTYISFTGSPLWSIRSFLMSNGAMKIAVALSIVLTPPCRLICARGRRTRGRTRGICAPRRFGGN